MECKRRAISSSDDWIHIMCCMWGVDVLALLPSPSLSLPVTIQLPKSIQICLHIYNIYIGQLKHNRAHATLDAFAAYSTNRNTQYVQRQQQKNPLQHTIRDVNWMNVRVDVINSNAFNTRYSYIFYFVWHRNEFGWFITAHNEHIRRLSTHNAPYRIWLHRVNDGRWVINEK